MDLDQEKTKFSEMKDETEDIDEEENKKEEVGKSIKIRVYPTHEQKKLYNILFGCNRFIYNKTIEFITEYRNDVNNKKKKFPSEKILRFHLIKNDSKLLNDYPFLRDNTVFDFRDNIMRICLNNYKSNIEKSKISKTPFKINFKTKKLDKSRNASITIQPKYWNTTEKSWWNKLWNPNDLKFKDKRHIELFKKINYESKLIRTPTNKYYIAFPLPADELRESKENICSIDPGMRTFYTMWNLKDNCMEEIGVGFSGCVKRLQHRSRKLQSLMTQKINDRFVLNHQKRHNLEKAYKRSLLKIENKIDDLHKSLAKYLCENYSTILVPKLNFHKLDKLNKKSKSVAMVASHCGLVNRLITKSAQYKNCNVHVITEEFTSKTCSNCGELHNKLGLSKIFECPNCNIIMDRDHNGAKNILIKTIYDIKSKSRNS
jgi:putative transposase